MEMTAEKHFSVPDFRMSTDNSAGGLGRMVDPV
jgi:hypothetical protein